MGIETPVQRRQEGQEDEEALREEMEALQRYLDANKASKDNETEKDKDRLRDLKDRFGIPYRDY